MDDAVDQIIRDARDRVSKKLAERILAYHARNGPSAIVNGLVQAWNEENWKILDETLTMLEDTQ